MSNNQQSAANFKRKLLPSPPQNRLRVPLHDTPCNALFMVRMLILIDCPHIMKKYRIHFYRACGLIVLLCSVFSTLPCGAREFGEDEKLVFAHDVPWFRPEDYSLYTEWGYNYPVHDSSENLDKMTILLHEESLQATDLGIDGLFLDIGAAAGGAEAQWSWMLPVYLKAAEGTDLQVSFCLDVGSSGEYWGNEFVRLLKECGNHPNFPRYQGKYVIATYCYLDMSVDVWKEIYRITREAGYEIYVLANVAPPSGQELKPEKLKEYLDVFDCLYMFDSPAHARRSPDVNDAILTQFCAEHGKRFMPCLHPGYTGAWKVGNDFYNPFRGFDFLYNTFEAAQKSNAKWFHITTWNDLLETAILERAFTPGLTHTIQYYAKTLKGQPPVASAPDVLLAYHREEIPGTLFRLEVMNLPCNATSDICVGGRILDSTGRAVVLLNDKIFTPNELGRAEWLFSTTGLAYSPHLIPEITITSGEWSRTVKAPAIHFVASWIQNETTVNVPLNRLLSDFPNTLSLSQNGSVLSAEITFEAPEKLRRILLFKNDHPIGMFTQGTKDNEIQLCTSLIRVPSEIDITVNNGRILRAIKKGQVKGHPQWRTFDFTETTLFTANSTFGNHGVTFAGSRDMTFTVTNSQGATREYKAETIARTGDQRTELAHILHRMDMTTRNDTPVDMASGRLLLNLFARDPLQADRFYVRYETVSGKLFLTEPVYPFAGDAKPITMTLLETPVNLETSVECYPNQDEFLTSSEERPFTESRCIETTVSPLINRTLLWHFERSDSEAYGFDDYPTIPTELYTDGGANGTLTSLYFDGETVIKHPNRRWPIGPMGHFSFWIKPAPIDRGQQAIISQTGIADGISFNMLNNGHIEILRTFFPPPGQTFAGVSERFVSTLPVNIDEWNHIELDADCTTLRLRINDRDAGSLQNLTPRRVYSYGSVLIGSGRPGYHPYKGLFDELEITGLAWSK